MRLRFGGHSADWAKLVPTLVLVAASMPATTRASVNILPMGNSISNGTGSVSSGGYREPLQELLIDNGQTLHGTFEFIGGQDDGSDKLDSGQVMDDDNWARPGALAADSPRSNPFIGGAVGDPILNQDVEARWGSVFKDGPAEVVLLHIGTNPILGDTASDPAYGSTRDTYSANEAAGQLGNLLDSMQETYQNDANRADRRIAEDARIVVSGIVPKASDNGVAGTTDAQTVISTDNYNQQIDDQISTLSTGFRSLFSRADMFSIPADSALAANLKSLGVSQSQIDQMVDPDGDARVDWVLGDSLKAFNEDTPQRGDYTGINTALLQKDKIHPTELGYKVMASVWYEKLVELDRVPEPASLTLVALGTAMMCGGRRRRTGRARQC